MPDAAAVNACIAAITEENPRHWDIPEALVEALARNPTFAKYEARLVRPDLRRRPSAYPTPNISRFTPVSYFQTISSGGIFCWVATQQTPNLRLEPHHARKPVGLVLGSHPTVSIDATCQLVVSYSWQRPTVGCWVGGSVGMSDIPPKMVLLIVLPAYRREARLFSVGGNVRRASIRRHVTV